MPEQSVSPVGSEPSNGVVVGRGVKLLGEMVVGPGASLAMDGQILPGAAHFVGGVLARWAFGPVGWFLVAANSYAKSVTGKGLTEHLQSAKPATAPDA
jgi:Family of unknown function (DUF6072)